MDETAATLNELVKMSRDDPDLLTILIGSGYGTDYAKDLLVTAVTELSTARALLDRCEKSLTELVGHNNESDINDQRKLDAAVTRARSLLAELKETR